MMRCFPGKFSSVAILLLVLAGGFVPTVARAVDAEGLAAGANHTCVLTAAGGVKCWGENSYGQLGDGTQELRLAAVDVVGFPSGAEAIAAGREHSCVLTTGGGVKCWGGNGAGTLGDGTTTNRLTAVDVAGLTSGVASIAAGTLHSCALTTGGGVKCWGFNAGGTLGDGTTTGRLTAVDVTGLTSGVAAIAAGNNHTCALTMGGGVKCWGGNNTGALGDGTTTNRLTAVDVTGLTTGVASIAAGSGHTCALTTAGGVKCWGFNGTGALGDGTTANRLTAVSVTGLASGVAAIVTGGGHSCALMMGGGVKCWGGNAYGQLGDGTTTDRLTAADVTQLASGVAAMAAGTDHSCALTVAGGVRCWGRKDRGQVGDGFSYVRPTAVDATGLTTGVTEIAAGYLHNCILTTGGGVKCWGQNTDGQLGDGTTTNRLTAVDVTGLTSGIVAVTGRGLHTCALTTGGGVKCWGSNTNGQLGDGTTTNRLTAVDVTGLANGVAAIETGILHTCALTTGGGVKCWGGNSYGQLGEGTMTNRLTAVDVPGLASGVAAIAAGGAGSCALMAGGGVKCWGSNSEGQLGDGTTTDRLMPVDVTGLSGDVAALAMGFTHSCALTTGGGAKCWGDNSLGQLGDGSTTGRLTPVGVTGLTTGVATVAASAFFSCVVTTGGGAKCWGENSYFNLGDGTATNRLTAVDVTGLASDIGAIGLGAVHSCALTVAGGVKCWGYNGFGALGIGEANYVPTPVAAIGFGPVCGDTIVEDDEQCDDGNLSNGDCCSAACRFESNATVCRMATGECDVAETCSGSSGTCPADVLSNAGTSCTDDGNTCTDDQCDGSGVCVHDLLPDSDGDAVCDAQDACTNVADGRDFVSKPRTKLILTKVNTDTIPGNDKLTLGGAFALPAGRPFGDLDPQTRGARLLIRAATGGDVIDVTLPGGAYDGGTRRGWKTNARRSFWQYLDKSASPLGGITTLKATDRGNGLPGGMVALTLTGKNGNYPTAPSDPPLQATLVLGNQSDAIGGLCAESSFTSTDCVFNGSGNALRCAR